MGRFKLSLAAASFAAILTIFGVNQASAGSYSFNGYYGYHGYGGYYAGLKNHRYGYRKHRRHRYGYRKYKNRRHGYRHYRSYGHRYKYRRKGFGFVYRYGY